MFINSVLKGVKKRNRILYLGLYHEFKG